jgi:hypothetical protein
MNGPILSESPMKSRWDSSRGKRFLPTGTEPLRGFLEEGRRSVVMLLIHWSLVLAGRVAEWLRWVVRAGWIYAFGNALESDRLC